jgi:hypothetical protein
MGVDVDLMEIKWGRGTNATLSKVRIGKTDHYVSKREYMIEDSCVRAIRFLAANMNAETDWLIDGEYIEKHAKEIIEQIKEE